MRPIWSSSSIEKRARARLHAALEGGGMDQELVGPEERIGRLPGMLHHFALDQGGGHVDGAAAALDRLRRQEGRVVARRG